MTRLTTSPIFVAAALLCFCYLAAAQQSTNQQVVSITFRRFLSHYDYPHAEMIVSNRTARSVWFTGYSAVRPVYSVQQLEHGQWTEKRMGWCGTGSGRREFYAHTSITLLVPLDPSTSNNTVRVGISCSPSAKYDATTATSYWSDKIDPR